MCELKLIDCANKLWVENEQSITNFIACNFEIDQVHAVYKHILHFA